MSGIMCARKGCLASISWFGQPADRALTSLATNRGWKVLEGSGWTCPHHLASKDPQP